MTREETKVIIGAMIASYPNYKPADLKITVDTWTLMLEEYEYKEIQNALKAYIATDTTGFAPSIGQLIDKLHTVKEVGTEVNETAVWGKVYKAICNSNYHADEEFEKLDEISQQVIGSPSALRQMASNQDFNEGVEKSQFIKQYRIIVERNKQIARLPQELRATIEQKTSKKLIGGATNNEE